jgi:GT2 family glycosyltransferase
MHRCGTSYLAHALSFLGLELPKSIQGGAPDNPKGHFESFNVTQVHDSLFKEQGLSWDTFVSFDEAWFSSEQARESVSILSRKVLDEYNGSGPMILKDPRISLLLPLWEKIATASGIKAFHLLPFRHPLEVAASLKTRNQMSRSRALLIWLNYFFNAEKHSRGFKRSFIRFPQWTNQIEATFEKIEADLGTTFPESKQENIAKAKSEFEKKLVHYKNLENIDGRDDLESFCFDIYRVFIELTNRPDDIELLENLDRRRNTFEFLSIGYAEMFTELERKKEDCILAVQTQLNKEEKAASSARSQAVEHEAANAALTHELEQVRSQVVEHEAANAAVRSQVVEHEAANAALTHELEQVRSQVVEHEAANAAVRSQVVEHEAANAAVRSQVVEHEAANAALTHELEQVRSQAVEHEAVLKKESRQFKTQNTYLVQEYKDLLWRYQKEQLTILKPIYRNVYWQSGRLMRKTLPSVMVEAIKRLAPFPFSTSKGSTWQSKTDTVLPVSLSIPDPTAYSEPDLFILSIINWDFRYQRPQHIANGLSEMDRRVFYVEMELTEERLDMSRISENLFRIRLPSSGAGQIAPYTGKPDVKQVTSWLTNFFSFCDDIKATSFKQIVIQHPFWWQFAQHLPPEFQIIFDCMDDMSGFSNTDPFLLELEKELLQKSDTLIVSSQHLYDKYRHFQLPTLVRNGADLKHFSQKKKNIPPPSFLNDHPAGAIDKIKVGYVGAIAEWFDADLIRSVASNELSFEFHFCGAVTDKKPAQLGELKNVFMHGEIPYDKVPGFLQGMDVMIIPFKIIPIIQACDPVKFYEYSAMGKPTVTTPLPELSRASHLVFFASTPSDFAKQIHLAHQKGKLSEFRKKLQEYAAQNTWGHRTEIFAGALREVPKVSVVILSYGDPELTKATLHSLYEGGKTYPNLEVLVVDNGSPDTALKVIREFVANLPDVKVIENGENLGFAKGNNVGFEAATGDYVLLLNNDTVISPGAIFAMVRHLQHDSNIGVVGPLTNNIGNEAKLFLEYEDMEQMKTVARQVTTGYRGVTTPIPVVAYFAAMFRRADLEKFGFLSEDYGRGMFEDDDHCAIIRSKGYTCALAEDAFIHHHLSATFDKLKDGEKEALFNKNKQIFEKKWGTWTPHQYRVERPSSSFKRG